LETAILTSPAYQRYADDRQARGFDN